MARECGPPSLVLRDISKKCHPGWAQRRPGPSEPLASWVPARRAADAALDGDDIL